MPGALLLHLSTFIDEFGSQEILSDYIRSCINNVQLCFNRWIIFHKTTICIPLTFHGIYWTFLVCARLSFYFSYRVGFSSEHHTCLFSLLCVEGVCFFSFGDGVTLNTIPVRLQWAQVMDIVINDIWFIRICQNGLDKLWPLERAQYCIVLGNILVKNSWTGIYYNLPHHSLFCVSLNWPSGCNHKSEMGNVKCLLTPSYTKMNGIFSFSQARWAPTIHQLSGGKNE